MKLYHIVIAILVVLIGGGIAYYFKLIRSYKNFVEKEKELMKDLSDSVVDTYIELFTTSYIPDTPKILSYRTKFYLSVKQSEQVSYQKKKELLDFFKEKNIPVFSSRQKEKSIDESIEELIKEVEEDNK